MRSRPACLLRTASSWSLDARLTSEPAFEARARVDRGCWFGRAERTDTTIFSRGTWTEGQVSAASFGSDSPVNQHLRDLLLFARVRPFLGWWTRGGRRGSERDGLEIDRNHEQASVRRRSVAATLCAPYAGLWNHAT
jgi:hypothetical protein